MNVWKAIIISFIIGMLIGSSIILIISKGKSDEYKDQLTNITDRNNQLIKLNSETKATNIKLKNTVEEFKKQLIGDYREFEHGLGLAGDTIEELGKSIESAAIQIQGIISAISEVIQKLENMERNKHRLNNYSGY